MSFEQPRPDGAFQDRPLEKPTIKQTKPRIHRIHKRAQMFSSSPCHSTTKPELLSDGRGRLLHPSLPRVQEASSWRRLLKGGEGETQKGWKHGPRALQGRTPDHQQVKKGLLSSVFNHCNSLLRSQVKDIQFWDKCGSKCYSK